MGETPVLGLQDDVQFGFVDRTHKSHQILHPRLLANSEETRMLDALLQELQRCSTFRFSVAFISASGLALLKQALYDFKGHGTIVTSRYLDFNEPGVFRELLELDNVSVYIYDHPKAGFHAKGYIFESSPLLTAIIGSSNLTAQALIANQEWNLKFSATENGNIAHQINSEISQQLKHSVPLTLD